MALMSFREENHVKWMGVRPGHDGTQIIKYALSNNATVVLYTAVGVTVAEIVYLSLSVSTGAVAGVGSLQVFNAVPALVNSLMLIEVPANGYNQLAVGLPYPLELLEDWSIRVFSSDIVLSARGMLYGWEE